MKEIHIYVEGPSDKLGLEKLLARVIKEAANRGNRIDFHPLGGKEPLLNKGPTKALNILRNKPGSWVFLLPDLYPRNKPFPHTTYNELKTGLESRFNNELQRKQCDHRLKERFFVHCFKYDMEVLLLASEESLMKRLGTSNFSLKWIKPVENQNHDLPPKRIIEDIFKKCGKRYKDTVDAPMILESSDYIQLSDLCNQNFKPFLNDLLGILQTG
ncbi:MAG: hypothetical protein QG657_3375 [Acidobacteriota bacterium]|nr:hypothetical protein [Acidobacteriota bacterium]